MICSNFVCAFASFGRGKLYCTYNGNFDCDITRNMSCSKFSHLQCKFCCHDIKCFSQREKGVFYSVDKGSYIPSSSAKFIEYAEQNALINAKHDIYVTACNDYCQGYKVSTTVNKLFDKYNKTFPEFTKQYLNEAVHKSILHYIKNEE